MLPIIDCPTDGKGNLVLDWVNDEELSKKIVWVKAEGSFPNEEAAKKYFEIVNQFWKDCVDMIINGEDYEQSNSNETSSERDLP